MGSMDSVCTAWDAKNTIQAQYAKQGRYLSLYAKTPAVKPGFWKETVFLRESGVLCVSKCPDMRIPVKIIWKVCSHLILEFLSELLIGIIRPLLKYLY